MVSCMAVFRQTVDPRTPTMPGRDVEIGAGLSLREEVIRKRVFVDSLAFEIFTFLPPSPPPLLRLSASLSACLSVCLPACRCLSVPVCLSVCLSLHVCLPVFLHPLLRPFVEQVSGASRALEDALQFKAATVPEDLKGHFVVIGAHPRLQHYVVALRRQRPSVVIVVVTDTEVSGSLKQDGTRGLS